MSQTQSQYESSEDENESEEQKQPQDEYYEEMRGEYEEDEVEHGGEEYWYIQSNRDSASKTRSRSSRSSPPISQASTVASEYRRPYTRSIKKSIVGGIGYTIVEEEIQHQDNHDLIDSLPEDISNDLSQHWQEMEDFYYPISEKSSKGIAKAHNKILEYPDYFQEQFSKQLDAPDGRSNLADNFKTDFNRLPFLTRNSDQVKSTLYKRIGEFVIKLEGVTEEKYAKAKHVAFSILSKGILTSESEKMARLFGALLRAETDRFADTIRFINEHYYSTIAIDLAMPNKVRWKEIMDTGLIKKKFICEHFREQCLLREELRNVGSCEDDGSSSDADICDGGSRGKDLKQICEDGDGSNSTDEELDNFYDKYDNEVEEIDFGENQAKMNGEMKISLEFDNQEFLGEGGWEGYSHRYSGESAGTMGRSNSVANEDGNLLLQENEMIHNGSSKKDTSKLKASGSKAKSFESSKLGTQMEAPTGNGSKINVEMKTTGELLNDKRKPSESGTRKPESKSKSKQKLENEQKYNDEDEEPSHFDNPEEDDEELEMEPEKVEFENQGFFDDELPGEFWEGEGDDMAFYRASKATSRARQSSVKFDEKETYIRDFFWDSDPSKQDVTDTSKPRKGKEKDECADEDYFDENEFFDEDDIFYNREEFFEKDVYNTRENVNVKAYALEPEDLHFALFGRKMDEDLTYNMSLLNKLLLRWTSRRLSDKVAEVKLNEDEKDNEEEQDKASYIEEEGDGDGPYTEKAYKSFSSSGRAFSPTTPASMTKNNEVNLKIGIINTMTLNGEKNGVNVSPHRASVLGADFSGITSGLLKLYPTSMSENIEIRSPSRQDLVPQKLPLLNCFINLQNETWNGFEVAFREARRNIEKVISSLRKVISKAYPIEDPRNPCEKETNVNELLAKAAAIKDKYRGSFNHLDKTSKAHKHVHLKEGSDDEEEMIEIDGEEEHPFHQPDEDNEEDENIFRSPKSSFVELVPLNTRLMSTELESENKRSSLAQSEEKRKKEKKVSMEESGHSDPFPNKSPVHDTNSGSNYDKHNSEDSRSPEEAGMANEKKTSRADSANVEESEKEASLHDHINSPQSDSRTESTGNKSTVLERTPAEIDIRLTVEETTPPEPTPEEKKILRRAKHALLKMKLQNWENVLDIEAERLARELALIESHAQNEFYLLKQLPLHVWENSKSQAANVYKDDLKKDAEVGEIFRCATHNGSQLYGKFYIDRRDLMLLLKENDPPIPLKYTDEYARMSRIFSEKKKSKKSALINLEE